MARYHLLRSLVLLAILNGCDRIHYHTVIQNVRLYDGSGSASVVTDIGISGDTIAFVGEIGNAEADLVLDGSSLAVAPGFIDAHSHHDRDLARYRDAPAVVSQGITTIVVGQDGSSEIPLRNYFQKLTDSAVAVNVASYSGHNTIRERVMGGDFQRKATYLEVERMRKWLRDDLEAGALGFSTGLEYDPGIYSDTSEVLALAKVLPEFDGRYISHLRSEDRYFWAALKEIIEIGRVTKAPVQISHFKLAMRNLWGMADSTLQLLNKARQQGIKITADIYPYAYWSSTIRVLFPNRNFSDLKEAAFILKEVTTPEGIIFSSYGPNPEYNGKSLAQVAQLEQKEAPAMLVELIRRLDECEKRHQECDGSIVATSMEEADIELLLQWPFTGICSDGSFSGRHPRGYGAFPRVLSKYVREEQVLSIEEAIYKMTGLNAENLGIKKRGFIKQGYFADLVLFDPTTVADQSTIDDPRRTARGIERVWVNGVLVYSGGKTTGHYPGVVVKRTN